MMTLVPEDDYVTVKIPKSLSDEIDKLVGTYGFKTRTEVVKEAVRRYLFFVGCVLYEKQFRRALD